MRKGFAGLAAGVVGVLSLAALAPTAQAHPCAVAWTLENASFLSANNAAWGAKLPTVEEFSEADCAGELTGLYGVETDANAAADPVGDATSTHERTPNLVPTGFSARNVALVPSLVGINSDLAFKDNLVFQGHFSGFRVLDVTDPANPVQLTNYEACHHNSGQGDVIVYGNLLVRSWDSGSSTASHTCGGQPVGVGFEGSTCSTSPIRPSRSSSAACGCRRPATRRARPRAAARTPRPRCPTPRAATSTSTTAARAAPARAWTSCASSSRTRRTRSSCVARPPGARAMTTT